MSVLLKDRVWTMLSEVAKRGVYPLHGNKLGIYRIPIEITDKSEISSIISELRSSGFKIDTHADRIYITYKWTEKGSDPVTGEELSADLNITVEIVTGEVVDLIYQIRQLEYFGDPYWIKNYRQKADQNAKMVIDTIIRNTKIGDKLITHWQKAEKLTMEAALKKLEELTPLAKNPKARSATAPAAATAAPRSPARFISSARQARYSSSVIGVWLRSRLRGFPSRERRARSSARHVNVSGTAKGATSPRRSASPETPSSRQRQTGHPGFAQASTSRKKPKNFSLIAATRSAIPARAPSCLLPRKHRGLPEGSP